MLIDNIGCLLSNEPTLGEGRIGLVRQAAVVIDGDRVVWVGDRRQVPEATSGERFDVGGRCVLPGFVDSHTHVVFAGDRAEEFAARMAGRPYRAGGIRTTVMATRAAGDEELLGNAQRLAAEALAGGTTTLEVKSGYGLTIEDERRSLEVAARVSAEATFLGAHVVPPEYESLRDAYVDLVRGPMLDACAGLARWCDVFCDRGAFDGDQARAVLESARQRGLGLRVHANQLGHGPGARLAASMGAASADHLTYLTDTDVEDLAGSGVVATLLPAAEFSTRSPYPDARRLLDAGATIALATDCNPGTSYTTSMSFVIALAVRELGLHPDEAVLAATLGGARALRRDDIGVVAPGARADLVVLEAASHVHLAYRPGVPLVSAVIRGGAVLTAPLPSAL